MTERQSNNRISPCTSNLTTERTSLGSGRKLRLVGGQVYDPVNRLAGQVTDLWIVDGRVVEHPNVDDQRGFQTIDLTGRVVMPGGVDIHSHIVGPKVNEARKLQPELFVADYLAHPERTRGSRQIPVIEETALQYLAMGYTTVFDAAISPLASRHVLNELEIFPVADAGFFSLVGNNHFLLECAANQDVKRTGRFLTWLLGRCQSYAPKIVNPGGVESWKQGRNGTQIDLDETVIGFATTPRQIISTITQAANERGLPHPVHIHCNNLGMPGNAATTLETMKTIGGLRAHLTHIQFHSYGGDSSLNLTSDVDRLVDFVNEHPDISVDVGQVLFGKTTSMTGDGPLGYFLSQLSGKKWISSDTEIESGCGISPIEYRDRSHLNALQWAVGLEWYLKVRNPWQIAMSTDHPNGASFLAYPQIIRLLMDRDFRNEQVARLPKRVRGMIDLTTLTREYSLSEICIITRAAPARMLGLLHKGHLGPGADADICAYTAHANQEQMFQSPWMVIKDGNVIVREHELVGAARPRTHAAVPTPNPQEDAEFVDWFNERYSIGLQSFGVTEPTRFFSRPVEIVRRVEEDQPQSR